MSDKRSDPKLKLSDGVYRFDHPDSDIFLPEPVREPSVERSLGDYINNLRKKLVESYKFKQSSIPDKPAEPIVSSERPHDYTYDRSAGRPTILGNDWFKCPDSNGDRYCHKRSCSIGCKSINQRENRKQQSEYWNQSTGDWPCVVVGVVCKTNADSTDNVCRTPDSSGFAK